MYLNKRLKHGGRESTGREVSQAPRRLAGGGGGWARGGRRQLKRIFLRIQLLSCMSDRPLDRTAQLRIKVHYCVHLQMYSNIHHHTNRRYRARSVLLSDHDALSLSSIFQPIWLWMSLSSQLFYITNQQVPPNFFSEKVVRLLLLMVHIFCINLKTLKLIMKSLSEHSILTYY